MVVFNRRLSLSIQHHVDDGRSNHAIKPFHHNKDPKMAPCWYSTAQQYGQMESETNCIFCIKRPYCGENGRKKRVFDIFGGRRSEGACLMAPEIRLRMLCVCMVNYSTKQFATHVIYWMWSNRKCFLLWEMDFVSTFLYLLTLSGSQAVSVSKRAFIMQATGCFVAKYLCLCLK